LNTVGAGAGSGKSMFMASASFRIFASAMGLIAGCARKPEQFLAKNATGLKLETLNKRKTHTFLSLPFTLCQDVASIKASLDLATTAAACAPCG
jgi:hypothetical protein